MAFVSGLKAICFINERANHTAGATVQNSGAIALGLRRRQWMINRRKWTQERRQTGSDDRHPTPTCQSRIEVAVHVLTAVSQTASLLRWCHRGNGSDRHISVYVR